MIDFRFWLIDFCLALTIASTLMRNFGKFPRILANSVTEKGPISVGAKMHSEHKFLATLPTKTLENKLVDICAIPKNCSDHPRKLQSSLD